MGNSRKSYFFLSLAAFAACLVLGVVPVSGGEKEQSLPAWVEPDVDRPGSDFRILWLRGGLEACQEACAENPLCKSYTYVKEGSSERIEGCWLKDAVAAPVSNACCVSGVKTGETVSRYLQKPVTMPRKVEVPQTPPQAHMNLPGQVDAESEAVEENEPETGSGERRLARLDFSVIPPGQVSDNTREGNRATVAPPADVGTGRRRAKGMDFAAMPPGTTMQVSEPAPGGRRDTGAARRGIRGVLYVAVPPSGGMFNTDDMRFESMIRKVTGVDLTAVPPE